MTHDITGKTKYLYCILSIFLVDAESHPRKPTRSKVDSANIPSPLGGLILRLTLNEMLIVQNADGQDYGQEIKKIIISSHHDQNLQQNLTICSKYS